MKYVGNTASIVGVAKTKVTSLLFRGTSKLLLGALSGGGGGKEEEIGAVAADDIRNITLSACFV